MYNGKTDTKVDDSIAMVFHIFLCNETSEIVKDYFDLFVETGVYDKCGLILVRIRYADSLKLNDTLKLLNSYSKVHIVSVDHNESDYYGVSKQYFKQKSLCKLKPQGHKLGEVESIIEMMCDPTIRNMLLEYDMCIFCHTKSASIDTKYNTGKLPNFVSGEPLLDRNIGQGRWIVRWFEKHDKIIKESGVMDKEKFSSGPNNFFIFKTKWVKKFCISKYLSDYANNMWIYEKLKLGKAGNPFVIETDCVFFKNRHAFACFNYTMNFLYVNGSEEEE